MWHKKQRVVLNGDTGLAKAISSNNAKTTIIQLSGLLKEQGVTIKTVIEHGPGYKAVPATVFIKNGVDYIGVDRNNTFLQILEKQLDYFVKEHCKHNTGLGQIKLVYGDATELKFKEEFKQIERPLLLLFYDSISFLEEYAGETHMADKLFKKTRAESKAQPRLTAPQFAKILFESKKTAEGKIIPSVINKYVNFMKEGDVVACLPGFYAKEFYHCVKNKPFKKEFLIKDSHTPLGVVCIK